MKRAVKTWPELFARMANSDPSATLPAQRRALLTNWCQLAGRPEHGAYADPKVFEAVVDDYFDTIHRTAWRWIRTLLRGEPVSPPADVFEGTVWALDDERKRLIEDTPRAADRRLGELVETMRARPFPLRFCPVCETVFARDGKRAYCSTQCSQRQRDSDRLTPEYRRSKRLQMRAYRKKAAKK